MFFLTSIKEKGGLSTWWTQPLRILLPKMWLYIWQLLALDLLVTHPGRVFHSRLQYQSGPSTGTGPQTQTPAIMNTIHMYLM